SFPLACTLRGDALACQPLRDLAIVVADFHYCCLNKGRVGTSVVVGQLSNGSRAPTRQGKGSLSRHRLKSDPTLGVKHILLHDQSMTKTRASSCNGPTGRKQL